MSSKSKSPSEKNRNRSHSEERKNSKLFITNIDGQVPLSQPQTDLAEIETELRKLFEKYGTIDSIVAKRNRNSEYCFAFV